MIAGSTQAEPRPEHPNPLSVVAEYIPVELKQRNRWVTWKSEFSDEKNKWTKPPYQTNGVASASSIDPATWGKFEDGLATYQKGLVDGIGFVVSYKDDFIGIDLDHCVDLKAHKGEQWAVDIVHKMQSYTEFSPSGEGIRIFVKGN